MMGRFPTILVIYLTILSVILGACGGEAKPTPNKLTGKLILTAPEKVNAGEDTQVTVGAAQADDGTPVTLIAIGSYGPKLYRASFSHNQAVIKLPTRESGLVSLVATSGEARGEAKMTVIPGTAINPLTPLVGARAIIADANHWSMVVAVPFDSYDNPVGDSTTIQVKALHPDNRLEEKAIQVKNLVAWTRLYSGTKAGKTTITVQSGKAYGPDNVLLETPGWPESFGLTSEPDKVPADGRSLVTLKTDILKDHFNNIIADGTLITFIIESPDGAHRTIPAYSLSGKAEAPLQAPSEPIILKVWAVVFGVESTPLQLSFIPGPAVGIIPVEVTKNTQEHSVTLKAGPLLGNLGQFVPDGVSVQFRLTDSTGQRQVFSASADSGFASVEIRLAGLQLGNYVVEVLAGSGQGSAKFSLP